MAENSGKLDFISQKDLWKLLLDTSAKKPEKIEVADNLVDGLFKGARDVQKLEMINKPPEEKLTPQQKKFLRDQSREDLTNLNIFWLDEMINGQAQLREKISLFWHGHFACRVINSFFQQDLLQVIRMHALGSFRDLLIAVSKSPSMLQFLNNQQNRKQHPNENFAREVMELFTMGRGNYTEQDVKEAARAFTGWGFNLKGEFVFRRFQHDDGQKTFLGRKGNFDGDDILDILLEQPQTANYITRKLYRFLVNETEDEQNIKALATRFQKNNYDVKSLLTDIFTSDWFYDEKNVGNRIKSPVELLVGIRRFLPMKLDKPEVQLLVQRVLGQVLFFPPNVAGWPGGKNWIDSSSLLMRLRIPQAMAMNDNFDIQAKTDDDVTMGKDGRAALANRFGNVEIDWKTVFKLFSATPREQLPGLITGSILQREKFNTSVVEKFISKDNRENYIRTLIIQLMSTPEYQLC